MGRKRWSGLMAALTVTVLALAFGAAPASADDTTSVLVAQIPGGRAGSVSCLDPNQVPNSVAFVLLYGFSSFGGGDKSYGIDADLEIGGISEWSSGQTGFFDFTPANSPDFNGFESRLVDGTDDNFSRGQVLTLPDGTITFGSTTGTGPESGIFGGSYGALLGADLTFIRLIVDVVSISYENNCTLSYTFDVTWQFWAADTIAPDLTVPADITAEATGPNSAVVNFAATATDDYDPNPVVSCSPASGSTFALGSTTVTCTATDASGNQSSATFAVIVEDTTAPSVTVPADITAEAIDNSGAPVIFAATATDTADPNPVVSCTPPSGSTFPIGTTSVNCTATDAAGNQASATFDVTVQDTTAPALTVPADITIEATSPSGAVATFAATATDDADPNPVVSCTPPSGSTFALGTTVVSCTATDAAGNFSGGSFNLTVQDNMEPELTVPADITTEATGPTGAVVTFGATATDNADPNPTVSCVPPSGSTFALGTTTATCTATDAAGNQASATFDVTVEDTTAPSVTVPADITTEATGPSGAVVAFAATATDVADPNPTVSCSPASGSTFALGTTTVTCTATDAEGNQSSASFNVTVQDTTVPVLTVPADMTVDATGPSGAVVNHNVTATDIFDVAPMIVCQPISGSLFAIGSHTVTCTATDSSGNQSTDSFLVTVNGAIDQLSNLYADVEDSTIQWRVKISLGFKLGLAELRIELGRPQMACTYLKSFADQVQTQIGRGLSAGEAQQMIEDANRIGAVIDCSIPDSPRQRTR